MKHPSAEHLALYSGGDLPLWTRLWVTRHIRTCDECASEVEENNNVRAGIGLLGQVPVDFNWERMEDEMRANIRLGLEAGAIVARAEPRPSPLGWRAAVAFACVSALVVAGWILYFPRLHQSGGLAAHRDAPVVIESSQEFIEVKQGASGLALKYTDPGSVTLTVNAQGALTARYVDSETGYVTTSNVYVE